MPQQTPMRMTSGRSVVPGASSISEAIDCDLDWVMNCVNAMAIDADDGMELGHADLDELSDIGVSKAQLGGHHQSVVSRAMAESNWIDYGGQS